MRYISVILLIGGIVLAATNCDSHRRVSLGDGLQYEEYSIKSVKVYLLRIPVDKFRFEYHTSKTPRTPSEWQELTNSIAVINAGMYSYDNYMHVGEVIYKGSRMPSVPMKNYQGIFAFDPVQRGFPRAAVFDLNCTPLNYIKHNYRSIIQNMRFTSCVRGETLWGRWNQVHPMSVLGQDSAGNILFIFTPSEVAPRRFREFLERLNVGLKNAVYLEGGKEAGMFIKIGDFTFEGVSRGKPYPIPNVITLHKIETEGHR